jgi:hypothetical protein
MRITPDGNVGIANSAPSDTFEVGNGSADTRSFFRPNSPYAIGVVNGGNLGGYIGANGTNNMVFSFDTGVERMRIDSSGNLLVGTTGIPSASNAGIRSGGIGFIEVSRGSGTTAFDNMTFINGNGVVGTINTSGVTTSYVSVSDYRLKENVQPMTGALDKVAQLKPVTYTWKADGSDGQGFIAHELQAVAPDAVTGEKDAVDKDGKPVYQGVDTSFLVATLTKAIQELKAELDVVKAELNTLKGN